MQATRTVFRSNPTRKSSREQERGDALTRAVSGQTVSNYPAIFAGFTAKGIPDEALRAMLADAFLFERASMVPLSPDYFAELARDILAEQATNDSVGGVR